MLSFLHSFFTMKAYLPEYRIEKLLLDSAQDAYPVYEYCKKESIVPFIDLNPGHTGHFKYKDDFTIDDDGVPICKMGLRMHKDGHEPTKHRAKYRCPKADRRRGCYCEHPCSDTKYGRTVHIFQNDNPGLFNIPPIIREGVIQKTFIVSLSHELDLVKCYLELMQMRFPEVASYWSVDESLLQCSVFEFSLQPVLENCFSHAFKGATGRPKQIHINIYSENSTLVIRIQDNGIGIDEDSLNELKLLLTSENSTDSPQHVGIRNAHKRITNVFGNDYGITIESTPPGTTVSIRYPITSDFS